MEEKLKPCPFCGVVPYQDPNDPNDDYLRGYMFGIVACRNRDCRVNPEVAAPTSREAWNIWNRRPSTEEET